MVSFLCKGLLFVAVSLCFTTRSHAFTRMALWQQPMYLVHRTNILPAAAKIISVFPTAYAWILGGNHTRYPGEVALIIPGDPVVRHSVYVGVSSSSINCFQSLEVFLCLYLLINGISS
jgi:hypothetical protein